MAHGVAHWKNPEIYFVVLQPDASLLASKRRPILVPTPDKRCGFKGSAQHLRAVYSRGFESPTFFADVDLDAARYCPVEIVCSWKGRFFSASIDAASGWCFRSFLVARGCADHRNRLLHSWPP